MNVDDRIRELGIELPTARSPVGNYVPAVLAGDLLFLSCRSRAAGRRVGARQGG